MLKNRTFLGILCIIMAIVLVFAISPMFNKVFDGKKNVVVLKSPVMQGQMLTPDMLTIVEMGNYNLPAKTLTDMKAAVNKYAVSDLYKGSYLFPEMLTDTADTSDSMLRSLKDNERAMSITIKSFANGVSGKLITGDIIKIISVDDEKVASFYEELEFVEVLTTTTDKGVDNITRSPEPGDNGEADMPVTITVILQDDLQAIRLAECENTSLHAIFVHRGDEDRKAELLNLQAEIIDKIYEEFAEKTESLSGHFNDDRRVVNEDVEH